MSAGRDEHPEVKRMKAWFESLTIQQRINALTTTYPFYVNKLLEGHQ
jgi:hypothetical protein